MSNVGTARGQFKLDGLKQSIADLKKLRDILVASTLSYKKHRKEQKAVVSAMKQSSTQFKNAAGKAKFLKGAIKNLNTEIKKSQREMKLAASSTARMASAMNKVNMNKSLARLKTINSSVARVKKLNSAWVRLTSKLRAAKVAITGVVGSVRRLSATQRTNEKVTKTWFKRFGGVAAGFWVAYRAINAVEFALTELTKTWARGAQLIDEFRESVSTSAGMLGLMSEGLDDFQDRYTKFAKVMKGTMEESIRLAPKYRLSLEDIGNAYKEFAQFGVVITRDLVEPTLISIAMIKEIATTTSGAAKQIRQEIQAIFNGQARITDQFAKFVKRFPGLRDQIFGIAKAQTSNNQKWKDVIEVMAVYKTAIEESNKTIVNQGNIIKNNLAIVSSKAIETSGIYDKWVDNMQEFNKQLFDDKGRLRSTGQIIYGYFFRIWQIVDKLLGLLSLIGKTVGVLRRWVISIITPFRSWVDAIAKVVLGLHMIKISFIVLIGLSKMLWSFIKLIFFGKIIANIAKIVVAFRALIVIFSLMAAQLVTLVLGFTAWSGIFAGIGAALGVLSAAFSNWFSGIISNVMVAAHNFKELGKAITDWDYKPDFQKMVDVNTFKDMGTKAADAFFEAYDAQIGIVEDYFSGRINDIANVFTKLFEKLSSAFSGTELGADLKLLKAELVELTTFDDIVFPDLKDYLGDLDGIVLDMKEGLGDINDELKKMRDIITGEFSGIFTDIFSGELATFNELWDRSLDGIVTSFEKAMADLTTAYFDRFLKQILNDKTLEQIVVAITGSFSGGEVQAGTGDIANSFASGGLITEPVFGVGANSGESYSFAEKGSEQVIPHGANLSGGAPTVVVNVINKTSNEANATQGKVEFDGKRYVVDVIMEDVETGGPLRSLLGAK